MTKATLLIKTKHLTGGWLSEGLSIIKAGRADRHGSGTVAVSFTFRSAGNRGIERKTGLGEDLWNLTAHPCGDLTSFSKATPPNTS